MSWREGICEWVGGGEGMWVGEGREYRYVSGWEEGIEVDGTEGG